MFEGSIVALATPMTGGGDIDIPAWRGLVDFHLVSGTGGIVVGGTTGESASLSGDELLRLLAAARDVAGDRVPLIAGTGSNDTRKAVGLTRAACEAGADACLVVTPYYNKPSQEGLFRHFTAVADAASRPVLLYNVPGRTGCDMLPETVGRLMTHPRVVGIKEAVPKVDRGRRILQIAGELEEPFTLLSGDDPTALALIGAGARGVISVTANVAPEQMARMCRMALGGDAAGAARIDETLQPLHAALFLEPNPVPLKWALAHMKMIENVLRLPLTPMDPVHGSSVLAALDAAGVQC